MWLLPLRLTWHRDRWPKHGVERFLAMAVCLVTAPCEELGRDVAFQQRSPRSSDVDANNFALKPFRSTWKSSVRSSRLIAARRQT